MGAGLPSAGELAALRAWFEGIDARDPVVRYLGHVKATGQSTTGRTRPVGRTTGSPVKYQPVVWGKQERNMWSAGSAEINDCFRAGCSAGRSSAEGR